MYNKIIKIIKNRKAIKRILKREISFLFYIKKRNVERQKILIYDTSKYTRNSGDFIIMDYCSQIIKNNVGNNLDFLSTHNPTLSHLNKDVWYKHQIVCGTNLLFPKMERQGHWNYPLQYRFLDRICLLGVGWYDYDETKISPFSKKWYKKILDNGYLHSVRDSYTEQKLKSIGIENVINTSCPTMWELTSDFCNKIPHKKAEAVITTVTDYRKNLEYDKFMLDVLEKNYQTVYIWLQGTGDLEYIKQLTNNIEKYKLIPSDLSSYDEILKNCDVDYVGTRLHAGIRALNHARRSIIIAIDNRAIEISKDTNLPIIKREEIKVHLEDLINKEFPTQINLPIENIAAWKSQFKN